MRGPSHFAAPLLLASMVALILYISLYPFRFDADGPSVAAALRELTWARASRREMFNNVLLYLPLGFCIALAVEPRFGRSGAIATGFIGGALLSLAMEVAQASIAVRVPSLTDLSLNAAGVTVLLVLLLCMLQLGVENAVYSWIDLVIAVMAGLMVARWMPRAGR